MCWFYLSICAVLRRKPNIAAGALWSAVCWFIWVIHKVPCYVLHDTPANIDCILPNSTVDIWLVIYIQLPTWLIKEFGNYMVRSILFLYIERAEWWIGDDRLMAGKLSNKKTDVDSDQRTSIIIISICSSWRNKFWNLDTMKLVDFEN